MESPILFVATPAVNHQTVTLNVSDAIIYFLLYATWSPIESLLVGNPDHLKFNAHYLAMKIQTALCKHKQYYYTRQAIVTCF